MKKGESSVRKIIHVVAVIFIGIILIFLLGRYGWKLAGFSACQDAGIEKVEVTDDGVHLKGFNPSSFPTGFLGYYAKEENDTLYVGFKFSVVFGIFEKGDFNIMIPTKNHISKVIIKTDYEEYQIWPREEKEAKSL